MSINYIERNRQLDILFADLKLHMGSFDSKNNGRISQEKDVRWVDDVLKIERFITSVLMNKKPLFAQKGEIMKLAAEFEKLAISLNHTNPFKGALRTRPDTLENFVSEIINNLDESEHIFIQQFSEYLQLFFDCLNKEIERMYKNHKYAKEWPKSSRAKPRLNKDLYNIEIDALNDTVSSFRQEVKSEKIKKNITHLKNRSAKRYKSAMDYLDQLFAEHGKLTFIAIDLTFNDRRLAHNQMQEAFTKLIRNGKNHQALRHKVGHFCKWEYSHEKGVYCRVIFIFSAVEVDDIATQIEVIHNYWNDNITDGAGDIHNAKLSKEPKEFNSTYCTFGSGNSELIKQFKERILFYMTYIDIYYHPNALEVFKDIYNRGEFSKKVKEQAADDSKAASAS